MCNFCSSAPDMIEFGASENLIVTGEIIADSFLGNHMLVSAYRDNKMIFNKDVEISFCPMCGRNLKEESVDN